MIIYYLFFQIVSAYPTDTSHFMFVIQKRQILYPLPVKTLSLPEHQKWLGNFLALCPTRVSPPPPLFQDSTLLQIHFLSLSRLKEGESKTFKVKLTFGDKHYTVNMENVEEEEGDEDERNTAKIQLKKDTPDFNLLSMTVSVLSKGKKELEYDTLKVPLYHLRSHSRGMLPLELSLYLDGVETASIHLDVMAGAGTKGSLQRKRKRDKVRRMLSKPTAAKMKPESGSERFKQGSNVEEEGETRTKQDEDRKKIPKKALPSASMSVVTRSPPLKRKSSPKQGLKTSLSSPKSKMILRSPPTKSKSLATGPKVQINRSPPGLSPPPPTNTARSPPPTTKTARSPPTKIARSPPTRSRHSPKQASKTTPPPKRMLLREEGWNDSEPFSLEGKSFDAGGRVKNDKKRADIQDLFQPPP